MSCSFHASHKSRCCFDQMFRNRAVMEQLGPFGYHAYDAWTYTRATAPGPRDFSGRVSAAMLAELGPPPDAAPHVFICGPTGFVEAASNLLVDAGHDPARIRTERFGPA